MKAITGHTQNCGYRQFWQKLTCFGSC